MNVSTIDESQGKEAKSMIVDVVIPSGGLPLGFVADGKSMDFALSRARDGSTLGPDLLWVNILSGVVPIGALADQSGAQDKVDRATIIDLARILQVQIVIQNAI